MPSQEPDVVVREDADKNWESTRILGAQHNSVDTRLDLPSLNASLPHRYKIERELGAGGMGRVFLATDLDLERQVALKTILPELGGQLDWTARLRLEACVAAGLHHPNLVQVFEILRFGSTSILVMEYVEGKTLAETLKKGQLTHNQIARLMADVCEGIAYAHARGVIHRDIKPGNILISRDGTPKVSDFGLAVRETASGEHIRHVTDAQIIGSPLFMSPEQVFSQNSHIDTRSDVYSLGATLYYALTGRAAARGQCIEDVLDSVLNQMPERPDDLGVKVTPDLQAICFKALQKDPAQRYGTAAEMADDLRRALTGLPVLARRYGPFEALGKAIKARKEAFVLGLMLLLLMTVGLFTSITVLSVTAHESVLVELRHKVTDLANLSTLLIDPELVESVTGPQAAELPQAKQLADQLDRIRRHTLGVRFVYVMRQPQVGDPQLEVVASSASFLSDLELDINDNGRVDPDEEPAMPGEMFDASPYPAMLKGFQHSSADEATDSLDQWGVALSGYAPVRAANGKSLGVLGVDVTNQELNERFERLKQARWLALLVTASLSLLSLILLLFTLVGQWNRSRPEEM